MMKAAALGMPRSEVQAEHSTLALLQNDCQGPRVGSSKRVDLVILAVLLVSYTCALSTLSFVLAPLSCYSTRLYTPVTCQLTTIASIATYRTCQCHEKGTIRETVKKDHSLP